MWNDSKLLNATASVLFGIGFLCLILAGLWVVINQSMFTLHAVRVEGTNKGELRHVNAETIRSTTLSGAFSNISGNFFTADLDEVRQAFELVPWVRKASVRREWPDKLIVTIEEYRPLGTWGESGQLLSTKGEVFTANLAEAEEDTHLLEFDGPAGSEKEVLAHYLEFKEWFKTIGLAPEEVNYSKRYAWLVKLNNGLVVQLGREGSSVVLRERVDRLMQVYPQLASSLQGKIASVDLRYPNGFALQAPGIRNQESVKTKN